MPYYCTYTATWRCNIKCRMCNIWKKPTVPEMDIIQIDKAFKKIPNITTIRITGGEPFFREDLPEIIKIIKKNTNVEIIMLTTNGTFTDRIINFIKTYKKNNLRIKISLTGYADTHDEITCYPGAFEKVMNTIKSLSSMQNFYKFYLGINHAITNINSYEDSIQIRKLCKEYKLPYLPVISFGEIPLYSNKSDFVTKDPISEKYISLTENDYKSILGDLLKSTNLIKHVIEKLLKQYYLTGLYNQLVLHKKVYHPKCIVLKNHLRLLPNGDVGVCLYNSNTLGNLEKYTFESLWYSSKAQELRKWVNNCKGCWQQCDILPNLFYSGKIFPCFLNNLFS